MFATAPASPSTPQKVLALETSTERMSVALGAAGQAPLCQHEAAGGAQASATLLPLIRQLLGQVGWRMAELDAIAFGCGPGAFTGLRTTCAVVQGLAAAGRPGGIPVLPISSLLAQAQSAVTQWQAQHGAWPGGLITAALDARMGELYWADIETPTLPADAADSNAVNAVQWQLCRPPALCTPAQLCSGSGWPLRAQATPPRLLVSNAAALYAQHWPPAWHAIEHCSAYPSAAAVLQLSAASWQQGQAVPAAAAQPTYVRDKVALTTQERAAQAAASTPPAAAPARPSAV